MITSHEPYDYLSEDEVTAHYSRKEFPDVAAITFGRAMKGCWLGDFGNAKEVMQAISDDADVLG